MDAGSPSQKHVGSAPSESDISGSSSGLSPGVHDFPLTELPQQWKSMLDNPASPWLNSLGYCSIYNRPPADRVRICVSPNSAKPQILYYRTVRWLGALKRIEVVGFPEIEVNDLSELMRQRGAHVATSHLLLPAEIEGSSTRPAHAVPITHDVIVELPGSKDEYLNSLGRQKRQQLPRYWRRLQREFGDQVSLTVTAADAIDIGQIVQLIEFNQSRMARKGKRNTVDREASKQWEREQLTRKSGLLCLLKTSERILGGTFSYVHGTEAFAIVIGHDPQLERLEVGNLCLWKTIECLIDKGIARYHLLWGKKAYKSRFGGKDHPIVMLCVGKNLALEMIWRGQSALGRQIPRAMRWGISKVRR